MLVYWRPLGNLLVLPTAHACVIDELVGHGWVAFDGYLHTGDNNQGGSYATIIACMGNIYLGVEVGTLCLPSCRLSRSWGLLVTSVRPPV